MVRIMNVSKYAINYKYIVARYIDGDWWFFGAWNDHNEALRVAMTEGGQVFNTDSVNW